MYGYPLKGVANVPSIAKVPPKVFRHLPTYGETHETRDPTFLEKLEAKAGAALKRQIEKSAAKYSDKPWYGRSHGTWPGVTGSVKLGQPYI